MEYVTILERFLKEIQGNGRISPGHISLFVTIVQCWHDNGCAGPICVFGKELMAKSKLSTGTFHRVIRDLNEFGYIRYVPSYNHFLGSLVYVVGK